MRSAEACTPEGGPGLSWLCIAGVLILVLGILIITRPSREPEGGVDGWTERTEWFGGDRKTKLPVPKPGGNVVFVVK